MDDGRRLLKRATRPIGVSLDLTQRALVAEYEVESAVVDEYGDEIDTIIKTHRKIIRLKKLSDASNVPLLAQEILDRCSLIDRDALSTVIDLLYELQEKDTAKRSRGDTMAQITKEARRKARAEAAREKEEAKMAEESRLAARASMDSIDDYMDQLYDEAMGGRLQGAKLILALCAVPANLESIVQNESLMTALSRTTKDDYKKSMDLTLVLLQVFLSMSQYVQMHRFLTQHRVGDLTVRVLEFEHRRSEARKAELAQLEKLAAAQAAGDEDLEAEIRRNALMGTEEAKKDEEDDGPHKKRDRRRDKDKRSSKESKTAEAPKKRGKALPEGPVDIGKHRTKTTILLKKQCRVLGVAVNILLNLAEDVQVERKMVKRKVITFLVPLLERNDPDLVMLATAFLRKLSIFEENKNMMAESDIVSLLTRLVTMAIPDPLLMSVLRLLFNLSFDRSLVHKMSEHTSLLNTLVGLLKKAPFRAVVLRLLYHISQDDRAKAAFADTDVMSLVLRLIINFPQTLVAPELMALAINLTFNPGNVERVVKADGVKHLVSRVLKTNDALLMKMVRNIAAWSRGQQDDLDDDETYSQRGLWAPFVRDMYQMTRVDDANLLVEVFGTLANLTTRDLPKALAFPKLIRENSLVTTVQHQLVPSYAEDDIVLETIILVGTWAEDKAVPELFTEGGCRVVCLLGDILEAKGGDPEFCTQTLFTLLKLLETQHKDTLEDIVYGTEAVKVMCDMITSKDAEVIKLAQRCLDIVIDYDRYEGQRGIWREVQARRFKLYNREWLESTAEDGGSDSWLDDGKWDAAVRRAHAHSRADDDSPRSDSYDDTAAWSPGSPMAIGRHGHVAMDFETVGYNQAGGTWDSTEGEAAVAAAAAGAGYGHEDEWWD